MTVIELPIFASLKIKFMAIKQSTATYMKRSHQKEDNAENRMPNLAWITFGDCLESAYLASWACLRWGSGGPDPPKVLKSTIRPPQILREKKNLHICI